MIDKRLATLRDVKEYADLARQTGRRFAMFDVDAPLEVSLAGVLERIPGGNDPLPKFDVVADGFQSFRKDRDAVIKFFEENPDVGSYELFATAANGDKVKVLTVVDGKRTTYDEQLFGVAKQSLSDIADIFGATPISWRSIELATANLPEQRAKLVADILKTYVGQTWKEALDGHSRRRTQTRNAP